MPIRMKFFANRAAILQGMDADDDVQEKYVNAQTNKSSLDFLRHRSSLNSSVLAISEKMAAINSQLVEINREIMEANKSIVEFNGAQISANADMIGGSLSASSATTESNAAMIAGNSAQMVDLSGNVSANKYAIDDLLSLSALNATSLMKNKDEINERRKAIMENRAGIAANKAKIS